MNQFSVKSISRLVTDICFFYFGTCFTFCFFVNVRNLCWASISLPLTRAWAPAWCSGRRRRGARAGAGAGGGRGRGTGWRWAVRGSLEAGRWGGWRGTGVAGSGRPVESERAATPVWRRRLSNHQDYHASTSASPTAGGWTRARNLQTLSLVLPSWSCIDDFETKS